MRPEEHPQQPEAAILSQQVWKTLDPAQQQVVLKIVVSLCQQMIEIREQEARNEHNTGG